jgi:hypothetical protein
MSNEVVQLRPKNDWMLRDIRVAKRRNRLMCMECTRVPTVHFGFGSRCADHAEVFSAQVQARRQARFEREQAALAEHMAAGCPDDGITCPACCEHFDMDGGHCLDCGADRTEDLAAQAYDRAKYARGE